ncbi:MAG: type II toxin-antitoxin system Phd/YefM family antitoxin [Oscillospiraceae bacterium]|nr:type II toxin-antitoxin system Phd/YefM family antitoxin [Oscillospiraceae bacterium]
MLNRISVSEANKNFLKVIEAVDENGTAVILEDGVRKYILSVYDEIKIPEIAKQRYTDSGTFREISEKVLDRHIEAFRELAK